ncbi:uncharacterized protein B0H18DRAFT_1116093 [Fomitopsis serialis]|uniref:uncharacterized protein n=1 Tax=Fomitopsis serialis TaxID=139415 RepID=UPI002008AB1C|nr:uncharacterized protein B0H18DRAFT_1116093 [Neoantrodia serialis]KAH9931841.1 hypothetical protein B0H18DRAFT_1116093 [Neoantrodia serialis]
MYCADWVLLSPSPQLSGSLEFTVGRPPPFPPNCRDETGAIPPGLLSSRIPYVGVALSTSAGTLNHLHSLNDTAIDRDERFADPEEARRGEYPEERVREESRATPDDLNWIRRSKTLKLNPAKCALLVEQLRRNTETAQDIGYILVDIRGFRCTNGDNVWSNATKLVSPDLPRLGSATLRLSKEDITV